MQSRSKMIEQFSLQTALTYLTLISVPIGVFYHIMTLRNNEPMEWEFNDFEDFWEKYGRKNNPEAFSLRGSVGGYFEGMGVLVQRGLIDITIADDLISGVITSFWDKFGPIYLGMRKRLNYPQYGEWVEYLYNQIKPIVEEQHPELKT
jgi:hypothetical protein